MTTVSEDPINIPIKIVLSIPFDKTIWTSIKKHSSKLGKDERFYWKIGNQPVLLDKNLNLYDIFNIKDDIIGELVRDYCKNTIEIHHFETDSIIPSQIIHFDTKEYSHDEIIITFSSLEFEEIYFTYNLVQTIEKNTSIEYSIDVHPDNDKEDWKVINLGSNREVFNDNNEYLGQIVFQPTKILIVKKDSYVLP